MFLLVMIISQFNDGMIEKKMIEKRKEGTKGSRWQTCNDIFVCKKNIRPRVSYIYSIGEIVKLVSVVPPPQIIDLVFNQTKFFLHIIRDTKYLTVIFSDHWIRSYQTYFYSLQPAILYRPYLAKYTSQKI